MSDSAPATDDTALIAAALTDATGMAWWATMRRGQLDVTLRDGTEALVYSRDDRRFAAMVTLSRHVARQEGVIAERDGEIAALKARIVALEGR